jgi:hypothetical protein
MWRVFLNSESKYGYWKTSLPQKHMILACLISNKALWLQIASRKNAAHCIDISTNIDFNVGFKIVVSWVVLELRDKIEMLPIIILHCIITYIN